MFKQILQYLDIGGLGMYIWPCYILFILIVGWQIFAAMRRNILIRRQLRQNLWSGISCDTQT